MLKKFIITLVLLILIGGSIAYYFGSKIFSPNVVDDLSDPHLYIPLESSFDEVVRILEDRQILNDIESFKWVSGVMNYDRAAVPPGKYELTPGWNNRELITLLRSGQQDPVKMTFNNIRILEELAGKIEKYIQADSIDILNHLRDPEIGQGYGFDTANIIGMFIPNTYEIYWSTDVKGFFDRMKAEYDKFWTEKRKKQAAIHNLSPQQVTILASIVQKETIHNKEKPTVAGVYLNRLKKGMLLQADPTVVFANRNFEIKRVLNRHLEIDSPYNTYKYQGLPPGPICMPSLSSLDSVLNAEEHDYIFFCAKPGYNGEHAFAKTLSGHNRNANVYRKWLKENNIR